MNATHIRLVAVDRERRNIGLLTKIGKINIIRLAIFIVIMSKLISNRSISYGAH